MTEEALREGIEALVRRFEETNDNRAVTNIKITHAYHGLQATRRGEFEVQGVFITTEEAYAL